MVNTMMLGGGFFEKELRYFEKLARQGGIIFAYDSDMDVFLRTFDSYDDFRATWPAAEIVDFKKVNGGYAVWC